MATDAVARLAPPSAGAPPKHALLALRRRQTLKRNAPPMEKKNKKKNKDSCFSSLSPGTRRHAPPIWGSLTQRIKLKPQAYCTGSCYRNDRFRYSNFSHPAFSLRSGEKSHLLYRTSKALVPGVHFGHKDLKYRGILSTLSYKHCVLHGSSRADILGLFDKARIDSFVLRIEREVVT
ncbi:hypothetical protein EX30DRAFT_58657 [Ascodesmis nigricans]|uniref:Uncharacterized protein n=1 Tax=Ascodesmis nigricans TaxID=341454 RepID=A0A4S2MV14_9PEZI|nr:hypothetical protein EX30DRAFT_58657 [Ascodesmis nigricans]